MYYKILGWRLFSSSFTLYSSTLYSSTLLLAFEDVIPLFSGFLYFCCEVSCHFTLLYFCCEVSCYFTSSTLYSSTEGFSFPSAT